MLTLTIAQRRELKARAHSLNPVVMIGKEGLSTTVVAELDRALTRHELIKVKAQIDDRIARNALYEEICQQLTATPVQHIGKIFVIYRPKPEDTDKHIKLPAKERKRLTYRTKRSFQN